VSRRAEQPDMRHVDQVVVDLHHVGEGGADRRQRVAEVLEGALALSAEISRSADELVVEVEAELAGNVDGAAGACRLDHISVAWRRRHRLRIEKPRLRGHAALPARTAALIIPCRDPSTQTAALSR